MDKGEESQWYEDGNEDSKGYQAVDKPRVSIFSPGSFHSHVSAFLGIRDIDPIFCYISITNKYRDLISSVKGRHI